MRPKYKKEFFLIVNPKCNYAGKVGEYWHCFVREDDMYCEANCWWQDPGNDRIYEKRELKFDPVNYKRVHSDPTSYYIFVDNRCKLRRWMKENLK